MVTDCLCLLYVLQYLENARYFKWLHSLLLNSEIACRFYTSVSQITNNYYWTRLSKILWFSVASRSIIRLWQIIDLQDYFAITEFNNCFIIGSLSLFFNEHPREVKHSATFMQGQSQEGEKCSFILIPISRILFAAKHCSNCSNSNCWTTLHMSRLLFVSSYLQVTWWPLGQWKGRKFALND